MRNNSIFGTHTLLEATDRDANTKLATKKYKIILVIDEHKLATFFPYVPKWSRVPLSKDNRTDGSNYKRKRENRS
jgi:hypothetical protein